ncbi:MAG: hypothetical protein KIS62_07505 [Ramlibacter sp.]|nr:hypothetical protein [Ramlibacter sp.]
MGRLLAVFNVIAGGASIVGLYITAFTDYRSWILAVIFAVTAVFVGYVLFVPGNRLEANVSAKLQNYEAPNGDGIITKLHDEFVIGGFGEWKEIPFPHPFKEPPEVELIKLAGPGSIVLAVHEVTPHKLVVANAREARTTERATYRWVATGKLLPKVAPAQA